MYTCQRLMAHMWVTHGTHVSDSWHTCGLCVRHKSLTCVRHKSLTCVPRHICRAHPCTHINTSHTQSRDSSTPPVIVTQPLRAHTCGCDCNKHTPVAVTVTRLIQDVTCHVYTHCNITRRHVPSYRNPAPLIY